MSKRRKAGDWVWLKPYTGFLPESERWRAEIQPEPDEDPYPCLFGCGDPHCREWSTLWTEPDPEDERHRRHVLYHVCECQMLDEPWKDGEA